MKAFNRYLSRMPRDWPRMVAALDRLSGMRPMVLPDRKFTFSRQSAGEAAAACPAGVEPARWLQFLEAIGRGGSDALGEFWPQAGMFAQGIKAYCPTADEFEALGRVEVRVPWPEYRQPFETVAVVVPDEWHPGEVSTDVGRLTVAVSRHDPGIGFYSLHVASARPSGDPLSSLVSFNTWLPGDTETIEDYLARLDNRTSESMDGAEAKALEFVRRAALNACLLLANKGARRVGPANPEYAERLAKSLAKKNLPESVRRANEDALRAMPVLYGFDQHVRVFEREPGAGGSAAGGTVRPHWRRGHWAHQAHGPGGGLRKLVFRPAVMVNADRFGGDLADTKAVYVTA